MMALRLLRAIKTLSECYAAQAVWALGYPDRALVRAHHAHALLHPTLTSRDAHFVEREVVKVTAPEVRSTSDECGAIPASGFDRVGRVLSNAAGGPEGRLCSSIVLGFLLRAHEQLRRRTCATYGLLVSTDTRLSM
jgi:hypothetical protein